MMNRKSTPSQLHIAFLYILIITVFIPACSRSQDPERYRVMFYNVENLFDTFNDTLIMDDEFLPGSQRHWDEKKYYDKLNNLARVIISCGEWEPPAVVGLCEVENRKVLEDLVRVTPLSKLDYRILHFESPDNRGIDVAMLYREKGFVPDTAFPIPVCDPDDPEWKTRDILYVRGRIGGVETVHFFVNHWPSRYGGYEATRPKRKLAAVVLRSAVDSILKADPEARIIAMGDLNDGPLDESVDVYLGAQTDTTGQAGKELVNLTARYAGRADAGTIKYRENWDVFDQLIVSGVLLSDGSSLYVKGKTAWIHQPAFLLQTDEAYLGEKPFRTYMGMKYQGGFSDHLPVFLDLGIR